jgi:hypothetical protein
MNVFFLRRSVFVKGFRRALSVLSRSQPAVRERKSV